MARWSTEVRRGWDSLSELAPWWDSQPAAREIPFVRTRVFEHWGRAFAKPGETVQVHLLKRNGDLVAGLPLIHRPGRLYSLSTDQVDPSDVVFVPDDEVVQQIPFWLDRLPVAHFHCFREESPLVQALDDFPRWELRRKWYAAYLELNGGPDAARSNMSSKSRSTLRRRWRQLGEAGEVTFVDHPNHDHVNQVLEEGFKLEADGWKGTEGRAVLNTPAYEAFYRGLAEVAEDEGWLRLSSLYLDDRMVAFHLNLVFAGRRILMLTTFDEAPDMSKYSLGNLLLDAVIEQSCAEGLTSYEFGRGQGEWKSRWTSTARPIYNFTVFGSGARGRALGAVHRLRSRGSSTD